MCFRFEKRTLFNRFGLFWFIKSKPRMNINPFPNKPWFLRVCSMSLENTAGKGEIASDKQFLLFPQCFLENFLPFSSSSKLSSANPFSLEESKICRLGKG